MSNARDNIAIRFDLRGERTVRQSLAAWLEIARWVWPVRSEPIPAPTHLVIDFFQQIADEESSDPVTPVQLTEKWTAGRVALIRECSQNAKFVGGNVIQVEMRLAFDAVCLTCQRMDTVVVLILGTNKDGFIDITYEADRRLMLRGRRETVAGLKPRDDGRTVWLLPDYEGTPGHREVTFSTAVDESRAI